MRCLALSFLLGTWLLQQASYLPEPRIALAGVAALLALGLTRRPVLRAMLLLVAGGTLGFGLGAWRAQERLDDALPFEWEARDVEVVGLVADLPQPKDRGTRFVFDIERALTPGAQVPARVSLTGFGDREGAQAPRIVPGERWQLTVRLKRVRGLANPHAFDFEPWALERGIRATGYVRPKAVAQRLDDARRRLAVHAASMAKRSPRHDARAPRGRARTPEC